MITFKPFWETCKRKGITQYDLQEIYKVGNGLLDRIRHNRPINTTSIDKLCRLIHCQPGDVIDYVEDEK